ncbi:MAG TPA: hypothetical protein VHT29_12810 [Solirubrobacteraceae bacterium]|nr:hypothetical protein [Solirubrobacteraceae bacterium]
MRIGQATAKALARAVGLWLLVGTLCGCGASQSGSPASAPPSWAGGPWLGLNDNTAKYLGAVPAFARYGIAYDRSFELTAGMLPGELDRGGETSELPRRLREDHQYGMVPVVVIEYRGYDRSGFEYTSDPEFPQQRTAAEARAGRNTIAAYAAGFARSAAAFLAFVHARYPRMEVLFEVMNEPWGYTQPRYNAAEYADVIAQVLPLALAAGVPADTIYVAATGADCSAGIGAQPGCHPGWVGGMYAAQPQLRSEIQGWYLHPYGPPSATDPLYDEGIETLPTVRSWMSSGEDNVIVSEVGFCAEEVNNPAHLQGGEDCHGLSVATSAQAARDLRETLERARGYHEAGWLRALIVYSRNDGGWAMQRFPALALTPSGAALETFALLEAGL